jgi:hypothetical protein
MAQGVRGGGQQDEGDAALRQRAVATLRAALTDSQGTGNVHAAEVQLWDGYPQGVNALFEKKLATAKDPQRILIWRVLAQSSKPSMRRVYVEKVRAAALDTDSPYAEYSIESLAKLGYSGRDAALVQVARDGKPTLQILARWVLANSGDPRDETYLAQLLDVSDSHMRGIAAYALRFLKHLHPQTIAKLEQWTAQEPADASGRVFLLCALYLKGPESDRQSLKEQLFKYAETGNPEERYQAGLVLGAWAQETDLPRLARLLTAEDTDTRIAAAHSILTVLRRQGHAT